MFWTTSITLALAATLIGSTRAAPAPSSYSLVQEYSGSHFFDGFQFDTAATLGGVDPTHGFVNYTDFETATANELAGLIHYPTTNSDHAYIGVDYKTEQTSNGRNSVRITSEATFSNGALFIADVYHMPLGICGTWPALWATGPDWPNQGEIDIIEGVNDDDYNSMTLHTSVGCTVNNASSSKQVGTLAHENCAYIPDTPNYGCGVTASHSQSFNAASKKTVSHATVGSSFNDNGGGIYATVWDAEGISVYMFPRTSIPQDIIAGKPNPPSWSITPLARFAGSGCDFMSKFSQLSVVVNTDLCGDWAGETSVWEGSSCSKKASTCNDFVANNPAAFKNAFWDISSIKIYQTSTGTSTGTSSG